MRIGFPNHAFSETHALTVAGATVETGELANLRISQGDQRVVVRGTGVGNVAMHLQDLPPVYSGRTVQAVALLDVQVQTVGSVSALAWSVDVQGATGGVTAEPVTVPAMPDGFPRHLLFLLDAPVTDCQLVRIYLDATGTGEIEVALNASALWVSPVFRLTSTGGALAEGSSYSGEDSGDVQRPPGGEVYPHDGSFLRTHRGRTVHLTRAEAFGDGTPGVMDIQQLMVGARTTRPILWLPDVSSAHILHRKAIYGYFQSVGRISEASGNYAWEDWVVREAR